MALSSSIVSLRTSLLNPLQFTFLFTRRQRKLVWNVTKQIAFLFHIPKTVAKSFLERVKRSL
jgi:hypothetical protein